MNNFTITGWDEVTLNEYDGKKLSHAKVTQAYTGLLTGSAEINYQMTYTSETEASYIGTELFEGSIGDKSGSIVFVHRGTYKGGKVQSKFDVIEGSGTGELEGLSGAGEFASGESQSVEYSFDYSM